MSKISSCHAVKQLTLLTREVFGDADGCPEDSSTRKDLHPSDSSVQTVADAREARAKARAEAAAAALLASADGAEEEDVHD